MVPNQINLGGLPWLPDPTYYVFPSLAVGNQDLVEEREDERGRERYRKIERKIEKVREWGGIKETSRINVSVWRGWSGRGVGEGKGGGLGGWDKGVKSNGPGREE